MKATDIGNPDYFHKVVDCQWACPAHTPVPEYIRLIAAGRMAPAGLAAIERARANGSWEVLDAAERLEVPEDLAAALEARPPAAASFAAFPPSARKMLLGWVARARRPETRAARVAKIAEAAAHNERARG